jgi:hypothetical protein
LSDDLELTRRATSIASIFIAIVALFTIGQIQSSIATGGRSFNQTRSTATIAIDVVAVVALFASRIIHDGIATIGIAGSPSPHSTSAHSSATRRSTFTAGSTRASGPASGRTGREIRVSTAASGQCADHQKPDTKH